MIVSNQSNNSTPTNKSVVTFNKSNSAAKNVVSGQNNENLNQASVAKSNANNTQATTSVDQTSNHQSTKSIYPNTDASSSAVKANVPTTQSNSSNSNVTNHSDQSDNNQASQIVGTAEKPQNRPETVTNSVQSYHPHGDVVKKTSQTPQQNLAVKQDNAVETFNLTTTTVPNRSLGVDVSGYQGTNMTPYAQDGAKFAIVKLSEGTSYYNPNAAGQIKSAEQNGMLVMGYHFARFGSSTSEADREANHAIANAQLYGLPKGAYLACDYEQGCGAGSNITANTNAVVEFMRKVKQAGYIPLLYSGTYYMKSELNLNTITSQFGNCLWVASYPTTAPVTGPNFNYFPSMNHVIMWQYSDNWHGVDGDVCVMPMSNGQGTTSSSSNTSSSSSGSSSSSSSHYKSDYKVGDEVTINPSAKTWTNGSTINHAITNGHPYVVDQVAPGDGGAVCLKDPKTGTIMGWVNDWDVTPYTAPAANKPAASTNKPATNNKPAGTTTKPSSSSQKPATSGSSSTNKPATKPSSSSSSQTGSSSLKPATSGDKGTNISGSSSNSQKPNTGKTSTDSPVSNPSSSNSTSSSNNGNSGLAPATSGNKGTDINGSKPNSSTNSTVPTGQSKPASDNTNSSNGTTSSTTSSSNDKGSGLAPATSGNKGTDISGSNAKPSTNSSNTSSANKNVPSSTNTGSSNANKPATSGNTTNSNSSKTNSTEQPIKVTVHYVGQDGKVVGTVVDTIQPGSTLDVSKNVPKGYEVSSAFKPQTGIQANNDQATLNVPVVPVGQNNKSDSKNNTQKSQTNNSSKNQAQTSNNDSKKSQQNNDVKNGRPLKNVQGQKNNNQIPTNANANNANAEKVINSNTPTFNVAANSKQAVSMMQSSDANASQNNVSANASVQSNTVTSSSHASSSNALPETGMESNGIEFAAAALAIAGGLVLKKQNKKD